VAQGVGFGRGLSRERTGVGAGGMMDLSGEGPGIYLARKESEGGKG
jgi:hypothetical protein